MIDIEDSLFTEIVDKMAILEPDCFISPYSMRIPDSFPCLHFAISDNRPYERGRDSGDSENYARITLDLHCFTRGNLKKTDNQRILKNLDKVMKDVGFTRIATSPYEVIEDEDIYRRVSRYSGIVRVIENEDTEIIQVYKGG